MQQQLLRQLPDDNSWRPALDQLDTLIGDAGFRVERHLFCYNPW